MTRFLMAACLGLIFMAGCGSPESSFKKAKDEAAKGEHAKAVELFQKALAGSKDQAWVSPCHLGLARSQKALSKPAEAVGSAKSAVALAKNDKDKIEAVLYLAELLSGDKKYDEAEKAIKDLGKLGMADPRRKAILTQIARAKGAAPLAEASEFLGLDAVQMSVGKVDIMSALDKNEFPYLHLYVEKGGAEKIPSPDGTRLMWRGKSAEGYFLYVSGADGKNPEKLKPCKNAYQPSWAPDSRRILFSAMDYKTKKRRLMTYDLVSKKSKEAFSSKKGVGALAAFSPDGSKIAFIYFSELWMMNANGIGRTNVNLRDQIKEPVKEAKLLAWSKDGSRLAYQPLGKDKIFVINFVHKEIPTEEKGK